MKNSRQILIGVVIVVGSLLVLRNFPVTESTTGNAPTGTPTSIVEVKQPSELSTLSMLGETAFNARCAACHGKNAAGLEGAGPPLIHIIYEPGHHADFAFERAVQLGVRAHHWQFGDMPPVENLTGAELKSILSYVRELQRENGIN